MALVKDNILTEGFSGKIGGKIVFRQVGKRTIVAARPRQQSGLTEGQKAHRERFYRAVSYAKSKMLDPVAKEEYAVLAEQYEFPNAFTAAVSDYLKAPSISSIETTAYTGNVGDVVAINVGDNFKIVSMTVTVTQPDGTLIETGQATLASGDAVWKYVATQGNGVLVGTTIKVVATDTPGNETTLEKVIS